jgi:GT2 family glycosyltransferase
MNENINAQKEVSIIITTYGALKYVKACIDSIKKFTPPIYEIIIIDNNSDNKTKKYLKSLQKNPNTKVVFNKTNKGYVVANNQAIEYVNTKYVCLLNSDIVVSPHWLENLIKPLRKENKLAITIPVSNCTTAIDFNTKEKLFPRWDAFKIFFSDYSVNKMLNLFYGNYLSYTKKYNGIKSGLKYIEIPEWAGTWCVVFKKEVLDQVGGLFDEQFKIGYCEDVDFSWKIFAKKYRVAEVQNSFVHHHNNASFDSSEFDKYQLRRENITKLMAKYEKMITGYIKKETNGDQYRLAILATKFDMIKAFAKYKITKKE